MIHTPEKVREKEAPGFGVAVMVWLLNDPWTV